VTCFCHEACRRKTTQHPPQVNDGQKISETATSTRVWQRMLSGRRLDLLDPSPLDIESPTSPTAWRALRAGTGRQAARIFSRWRSTRCWVEAVMREQTPRVDVRFRLAALLHDAPEYVIGDMISPFKAVLGGDYKAVEKRLLSAIHIRFGLPPVLADEITRQIKAADRGAHTSRRPSLQVLPKPRPSACSARDPGLPPASVRDYLTPWTAAKAEKRFLARFKTLLP